MKKILIGLAFFLSPLLGHAATQAYVASTTTYQNYQINIGTITTKSFTVSSTATFASTVAVNGSRLYIPSGGSSTNLNLQSNSNNGSGMWFQQNDTWGLTIGKTPIADFSNNPMPEFQPFTDNTMSIGDSSFRFSTMTSVAVNTTTETLTNQFTANAGSTVTLNGIFQAKGITSGATPSSGFIGEVISSVSAGTQNVATSNQWGGDYVSVTLTPGGWLIMAQDDFNIATASVTAISWGVGTASGNSTAGIVAGKTRCDLGGFAYIEPTFDYSCPISGFVVDITASTQYWLKSQATYSVATPIARGSLWAIRIH